MAPGAIRARGLSRRFEIRSSESRSVKEIVLRRRLPETREVWALRSVDLDVEPGESIGVVGENGSGKSTLLKLLAGIFAPTEGTLGVGGRIGPVLELGAGFHPEFSGVENVYLNAAIYGLDRAYVNHHLDDIIGFAELEEFAHAPVKTYSSGMFMRLAFSVAVHVEPDVLLLDEVLAVGDEPFQQKCHAKIEDFKRAGGTIVFVSHDPAAVERVCDRAVLLERGRVVERGSAPDVIRAYHYRLEDHAADGRGGRRDGCRIVDVRAVDADGARRDRFLEGEPVTLEATLSALHDVERAQVTIGFRTESGWPIGWQTAPGVDLRAGSEENVELHIPSLPMREGRFLVDVWVTSGAGDIELARRERAVTLSMSTHRRFAQGPVALRGTWTLPRKGAPDGGDGSDQRPPVNGGRRAGDGRRPLLTSVATTIAREAIERHAAQKPSELSDLVEIVLQHAPRVVVEIGTMAGGTLYAWCRAAAPDATLVSIDLPGGPFGGGYDDEQIEVMRGYAQPDQALHFLRRDSHDPATVAEVEAILQGEPVDFLMIDGDHSYEGVRSDFELYAPLVRSGGMIAFHDVLPHPRQPESQVDRLWRELRDRYEHAEFLDADDDMGLGQWGGIGVLYVP